MSPSEMAPFLEVTLKVDAGLHAPALKIDELLALRPGSVILTGQPAGENVVVTAGQALLGMGELGSLKGKAIVRMLSFGMRG